MLGVGQAILSYMHLEWNEDSTCLSAFDSSGSQVELFEYKDTYRLLTHPHFGPEAEVECLMIESLDATADRLELITYHAPLQKVLDVIDEREELYSELFKGVTAQLNQRLLTFFSEMCFPELIERIPESMFQHMEHKYSRHCFASLLEFICQYSIADRLTPAFYSSIKDIAVIAAFNRA